MASYGNPYQSGPGAEAGYMNGSEQHEMQNYNQQPAGHVLSQQDFLSRVGNARNEMKQLSADVQQIAALHQRALTSNDGSAQAQLEALTAQTQLKNTSIHDQIRGLKADAERTADSTRALKVRQFESLRDEFKNQLQKHREEEAEYKKRYREQIARQYLIVNPDATESEVQQATEQDWGNEGVFQTALKTNRSGQASAVLGNVRARHNELQNIEKSMIELATMMQDMDTLIVQQDPVIDGAQEATNQTVENIEQGNKEVNTGIDHARRRRRNKWWCLLVVLLIVLAIALGVGLGVTLTKNATGANNNN